MSDSGAPSIMRAMERELTVDQAREIVRLRRRHPGAELRVHQKPWGVIVEARRGAHAIEIERFGFDGATEPERRVDLAA
jgi:hypothetical protein